MTYVFPSFHRRMLMPIFFLKSILSIVMLLLIFIAMFTMFEIFGKGEKRYNIKKLKKIHRANGIIFLLFFTFIAYFCLDFIVKTKIIIYFNIYFPNTKVYTIDSFTPSMANNCSICSSEILNPPRAQHFKFRASATK